MTKQALEKIPEQCKPRINKYHEIIKQCVANGNEEYHRDYTKKLRGILECLEDMGFISENDKRVLYLYYLTK